MGFFEKPLFDFNEDGTGSETQRQRGTGFFSQPGRSPCGTLLDRTIYL